MVRLLFVWSVCPALCGDERVVGKGLDIGDESAPRYAGMEGTARETISFGLSVPRVWRG